MSQLLTRIGRIRRIRATIPDVISEVNLTPLVDMALTLIVVFLIFLPALTTLIPISSTSSAGGGKGTSEQIEAPLVLVLSVNKVRLGNYEFDSDDKLIPWLRDLFVQRQDHKLTVRTDPDVAQQRLVTLLDDIRLTGDWKVALSTLRENAP
jgi:biopolymer transport protein ExbD